MILSRSTYHALLFLFLCIFSFSLKCQDLDRLKKDLAAATNDTTKLRVLNSLAENAGDDEWPVFNDRLRKLAEEKLKDFEENEEKNLPLKEFYLKYLASAINNQGYLEEQKGNVEKALELYLHSIEVTKDISDKSGVATTLNNIGYIYQNQGDVKRAIEYMTEALKLHEDANNKKGISDCLANLAYIYTKQMDIQKGLEFQL